MPFCTNCGREVSEDAQVCPYCGKNPRVPSVPAEKRAATQLNGLELVGFVLGIVGSVFVIVTGIRSAHGDILRLGFGFVGLGLFLMGILFLVFARTSKP